MNTEPTLFEIGAVGFATRRKMTWTLGTRYEISTIGTDGAYGDRVFTGRLKKAELHVCDDQADHSDPWLILAGEPSMNGGNATRLIGQHGSEVAQIRRVTDSGPSLFEVIDSSGQRMIDVQRVRSEPNQPIQLAVTRNGREIGRFFKIDDNCSAVKVDDPRACEARYVLAVLLHLDRYESSGLDHELFLGNSVSELW